MRWSAAVFGTISGIATWIVLAMMLGDGWSALTGPPVVQSAAVWAAAVVATVSVWGIQAGRSGSGRRWPHTLVPVFLVPVAGTGVLAGSQWRDAVETTALWAGFAFAAHVLTALAIDAGRRRRAALAGTAVVLAAGIVAVQVAAQERWFAAALRDRGLRPVVPVAAGFHADGVNLERFTLVVRMSDGHGTSFVVGVQRTDGPCDAPALCFEHLRGYGYPDEVPAGTTLRPVGAGVLARLDRIAETMEAD
ncbi:hypothetical protein [Dactylosporangium sp. NPDC005555]|uniref:hypothetical protein n=1 Tax=Dactylosporangium sp. NPDC005555 TaxID=3154889 RepID=UPI0033A63E74